MNLEDREAGAQFGAGASLGYMQEIAKIPLLPWESSEGELTA